MTVPSTPSTPISNAAPLVFGSPYIPDEIPEGGFTTPYVNEDILRGLRYFNKHRAYDWGLWDLYAERFWGWTKEIFKMADNTVLVDLRNHLRKNGVYVQCGRGIDKAEELVRVIQEKEQHSWTEKEIQEQKRLSGFSDICTLQPAPKGLKGFRGDTE